MSGPTDNLARQQNTARASRIWRLDIRQDRAGTVLVLTLAGRLGTQSSAQLSEILSKAIQDGQRRILCDLAQVDYLSSSGLMAFDRACDRLRQICGELVLCNVADPVRLALELAGQSARLDVAADRSAGLARLEGTPS